MSAIASIKLALEHCKIWISKFKDSADATWCDIATPFEFVPHPMAPNVPASAAGAALEGAPEAGLSTRAGQAHKYNNSLDWRARQLQALVRPHLMPLANRHVVGAFASKNPATSHWIVGESAPGCSREMSIIDCLCAEPTRNTPLLNVVFLQ